MSVATPTLIPRNSHFPNLLPPIPQQREPKPAASRGRSNGRINTHRDLFREMEDLSDEEADLEALVRIQYLFALDDKEAEDWIE